MKDLIYADECYKIIGACFAVYTEKGSGFLESVFQECLELKLGFQGHHPKLEWERFVL
ncbi:MAG: GxxExxY protein [Opitutus sp.]